MKLCVPCLYSTRKAALNVCGFLGDSLYLDEAEIGDLWPFGMVAGAMR